jgi:hypothetical protein
MEDTIMSSQLLVRSRAPSTPEPEEEIITNPQLSVKVPSASSRDNTIGSIYPSLTQNEQTPLSPRSEIIQTKIRNLKSKIHIAQTQLDSDLRFVRNIATLTPFRKSTRDRLENTVRSIAMKIALVRLEMTKFDCHHNFLSNDMAATQRDSHQLPCWPEDQVTQYPENDAPQRRHTGDRHAGNESSPLRSKSWTMGSCKVDSSIRESFHSALDFGLEPPSLPDDMTSRDADSQTASTTADFSILEVDPRAYSHVQNLGGLTPPQGTWCLPESAAEHYHEIFSTAQSEPEECAEEWNKTRAAHRVSLVRLPSALKLHIPALIEQRERTRL